MFCSKAEAAILDDFVKHLVTKVTGCVQDDEEVKQWTKLLEMSNSELHDDFEKWKPSSDASSKARWSVLFQDNGFISVLQESLCRLCEITPDQLNRMFRNGYKICFFDTIYHGNVPLCFAILGWYPPNKSEASKSWDNKTTTYMNSELSRRSDKDIRGDWLVPGLFLGYYFSVILLNIFPVNE